MTLDEAYAWYRDEPNSLDELLKMKCEFDGVKAENERLKKDVLHWKLEWESERDYADQMEENERKAVAEMGETKAENARLRDLVRLMHRTIGDLQVAFDASVIVGGVELSAEYFEREYMQELGIDAPQRLRIRGCDQRLQL